MLFSARCWIVQSKHSIKDYKYWRTVVKFLGVFLLLIIVVLEFLSTNIAHANFDNHTNVSTVNIACNRITFSTDGNPFPLCPGTFPLGGNCTWWSWEQWHLLGYDLPDNWGNAADWIVDATRAGLAIGTTPRVGSIAVFPRGDGRWAANSAGHVAFVADVSSNNTIFTVTYQNYGDPTFMYIGQNYNTSVINQPQYQNGQLRFIYFPRPITVQLFAKLPGISATNPIDAVNQANASLTRGDGTSQANTTANDTNTTNTSQGARANTTTTSYTSDRVALGLAPVSTDQELNADFTGQGTSNLLLYNRQQGAIDIFRFDTNPVQIPQKSKPRFTDPDLPLSQNQDSSLSQRVNLGDSITPVGKWGSALDIHVGDFTGTGADDILLYDRSAGTLQLISFNPDLTIKKHAILSDIGTGWEIYVGRLDAKRSAIFLYKRFEFSDPYASSSSTSTDQSNSTDPLFPPTWPTSTDSNTTSGDIPNPTVTSAGTSTPTATAQSNNSSSNHSQSTPTVTPSKTAVPSPTASSVTPTPVASPTPIVTPTPIATSVPSPSPTPVATPIPTQPLSPTPVATPIPTQPLSPTPVATPIPTQPLSPTPVATPIPPTATSVPSPSPTPASTSVPSPATSTFVPTTQPVVVPSPQPTATPSATAKPISQSSSTTNALSEASSLSIATLSGQLNNQSNQNSTPNATSTPGGSDLSGITPQDWNKQGRTSNILIMDFNQDFSIAHQQWYSLWHANWEVYVGRFVNAQQDGIFLYDRASGEARLMDFNDQLQVNDYQEMHNLSGNWLLYSGDFANIGRAQMLLYDPSSGDARMLLFDNHLALKNQQSYSNLGTNQVLYVGRFGMPTVSLMLYDPQNAQSTFIGFDQSLDIAHQYLVNSWNQHQQILVGSFLDHSQCNTVNPCSQDNILILNRQNGQIERYVFSFGRQFQVYDNRIQGLLREGNTTAEQHITSVDSSTFKLVATLSTTIHDEELY